MKHLSALVISLLIVVAISMYANGALAYFELDERLIGVPKRTVLPDGRIHIKYDEKVNQPFPEGIKFPATYQGASVYGQETEPKDHYFNFRGEAVMQARWKDFKLEEHTDADRTVCHERGDKNMRMSIFGASDALKAALKNNMKDIFIHADANKHVCHGNPIFRTVSEAHTFGDEILLVTAKPSYEDLFDEANVAFDLKHPKLTHFSNKRKVVEPDNHDHGVSPDDSDFANAAFPVPKSTAGSNMIPAKHDRMHARDVSEQDGYKINKQTFETDDHIAMLKRKGKTSGWFKKLVKSVTKVVSKVVTVVKSAVSTVTKAVAKGIEVVKKVVDTVKNLLTLTYEKQLNPSFDVEKHVKDYEVKQLKGIKFSLDFEFHAGLKFHLYIQYAKLKIFHASVYGSLDFGAGARLPRVSYTSSGQSNLWDIPGTTITFMIGPVPVWISYSTRCIAGYSMDAGFEAAVGFRVKASARLGVEYTSDNGFRPIAEKNFERSHTLSYSADFSASPFLGAQGRFALYSLITAYAQLNIGLNVFLTTQDAVCNLLKITIDFFIKLSAGLDIELKIGFLGINWSKSFGPWTVFDLKWPIVNVCKKKGSVAHAQYAIAEQAHLKELQENHHLLPQYTPFGTPVLRDAAALSNDEMTSVTEADSGKVWSTTFNCPSSNTTLDITATGFFQNTTTLVYLTISRNITGIPVTNQSNMTWTLFAQTALAVNGSQVKASSSYIFDLLAPTAANAASLGISHDDIQTLTKANGDQNTTAINLTSITISFGATMDQMTVQAAALCPANPAPIATNTLANNQTVPAPPVEGSYFGRMMESFGASLFPSFVRLITDVLVTVLIIALLEIAAAMYLAPRLVGEHWPKQATTPRTREYIYAVAGVLTGLLCMIIFVVGANLTFAEITGAQLAPNYTAPVKANESSFLVASGVQTIVWKFNGATVNLNSCPQYFPCSPDCRDLCVKQDRTWTNAPWPYCGDETVRTDNGGCTKFAWDNILNSILFVVFLFVLPAVVVKKCANIYRRLPILHACLMLAGMFLNLIWRRMNSFMTEVQVQMFSPADQMIIPFKLAMNADSQGTWKAAVTIYWLMIGAVAVGSAYDIYLFYKDTVEDRIVKFDQDFDANAEYNKADSPAKGAGNQRARGNTEFNADVAADLAGLGDVQTQPGQNELALM